MQEKPYTPLQEEYFKTAVASRCLIIITSSHSSLIVLMCDYNVIWRGVSVEKRLKIIKRTTTVPKAIDCDEHQNLLFTERLFASKTAIYILLLIF